MFNLDVLLLPDVKLWNKNGSAHGLSVLILRSLQMHSDSVADISGTNAHPGMHMLLPATCIFFFFPLGNDSSSTIFTIFLNGYPLFTGCSLIYMHQGPRRLNLPARCTN